MSNTVETPVEETEVLEEEVVETPEEIEAKQKKAALASFIMGIIAFLFAGPLGLVSIILGAIAISKAKKAKGVEVQPAKVFRLIGKILGIIGLVFGILSVLAFVGAILLFGTVAVLGAIGAAIYAAITYLPGLIESLSTGLALLAIL